MIALWTEQLWVWVAAAIFFAASGWTLFLAHGRFKPLLFGFALAAVTLAVGAAVVFFLPTDRKNVRKSLKTLASAIADNDVDTVLSLIEDGAAKTSAKAVFHMGLAEIDSARIAQLSIKSVNRFVSPPSAAVAFNGAVRGRVRAMNHPFSIVVHFDDVELVEGTDGVWRVSDRCFFRYPGYDGQ